MKKNNSALSLKNLAMSLKQSICLDAQKNTNRGSNLLRETRSSGSLQLKHENVVGRMKEIKIRKEQKQNRIFILEKQITYIQKQLQGDKNSVRNYTKQLAQFEDISNQIHQNQQNIQQQRSATRLFTNQIGMLKQQIHSIKYNSEERIAQKQHYQELLQTYSNQYSQESKELFRILQLEQNNLRLTAEIQQLQYNIQASQTQLNQWKTSVQFDLNQHKLKNSIKILRLQLIQCEDKCDQFCNQNSLRTLRQLFCLYFKSYCKCNGISNESVENGIDIQICKKGLVEDFSEFVRQRLIYNKPPSQCLQKYLQTLLQMERTFKSSNSEINSKLYSYFAADIQQLTALKQSKNNQIQHNQLLIKETAHKIDLLFNNDSIAVIQYMRQQNHNKYDIKQIKNKLRQNKKEQRNRIFKMQQSFRLVKSLQQTIQKQRKSTRISTNKQMIIQLESTLAHSQNVIDQLRFKLQKLNSQKENIQNTISNAITKWKQADDSKLKLKKLYSQLHRAKQYNQFALTKNIVDSPSNIKQTISNSKSKKKQILHQTNKPNYNKNTTISFKQTKSVLSLTDPYKKIMDRQSEIFQPIINNCQMIISRKLSSKDVQTKQFTCEWKESSNSRMSNRIDMRKVKYQPGYVRESNKQNDWGKTTAENVSDIKSKCGTSMKLTSSKHATSGKISLNQRISLSNLLLSKFNK